MTNTHYHTPSTLEEANNLYAQHANAVYLAGGQSLVPLLKDGDIDAEHVIALHRISDLHAIELQDHEGRQVLRVGAMMTHSEIAAHDLVKQHVPGVVAMISELADHQVRNQGTIGGSLAFCDPRADWVATCLAYGCTLHTSSRSIAMDDFVQGAHKTALQAGEVIVSVDFDISLAFAYAKYRHPSERWAMVGVGVARDGHGQLRVAVTGPGNKVYRDHSLESSLASDRVQNDTSLLADGKNDAYYQHLVRLQASKAYQAL